MAAANCHTEAPMFPLNIPNFLTVLRILLVPVIVVALLGETPNGDALAAAIFAVAALTDGLDGYLARHRDSVTTFGKLMDPLADKLLIIAPLVSLVSLNRIPAWVAMVIIAREFAVTALRMVAAEQGVVIAASGLGKAKTVVQVVAILAVIAWDPTPLAVDLLLYAAVAITIASGADYFFGLKRRLALRSSRPRPGSRTAAEASTPAPGERSRPPG
jgi:CDP-diacylglycerol--glycerol-3-phosphate 3-phosphatidyltransferase